MIFIYGSHTQYLLSAAGIFIERHTDKNIRHLYIHQLVPKFQEAASIANRKINQTRLLNVAAQIENHRKSDLIDSSGNYNNRRI